MEHNTLVIEVVYALAEQQVIKRLALSAELTVLDAINLSGILEEYPEISKTPINAGVFGKVCALDKILTSGDRVEIYRPLIHDPKEARRQRAKK